MRLLDTKTLEIHEFQGSQIPPYAILSHRWEKEEVTYQDLQSGPDVCQEKLGFAKIQRCCQQAVTDGLAYAWVDTCCIDKSSSADLSEAINSMYQWYQNSAACYAYLSDVEFSGQDNSMERMQDPEISVEGRQFLSSKWWTRGWTLQELIAPRVVKFFGHDEKQQWKQLGKKSTLLQLIVYRTPINRKVLEGSDVRSCSVANRMSWAAERETTRVEDRAYSLLGIFGVNMPLLYGEGERSFIRLQEEIMTQSDDQTLFAWELEKRSGALGRMPCGPLATSPFQFRRCSELLPLQDSANPTPYSMTNKGLRIDLPIVRINDTEYLAILQCTTLERNPARITLPIIHSSYNPALPKIHQSRNFARDHRHIGPLGYSRPSTLSQASTETIFMRQELEHSVQFWSQKVVKFRINEEDGKRPFDRPFFDPELFASSKFDDGWEEYFLPPNCNSGSIIFPTQGYHLIILYSINSENLERFNYEVICALTSGQSKDISVSKSRRIFQQWIKAPPVAIQDIMTFDTTIPLSRQYIFESVFDMNSSDANRVLQCDTKKALCDFHNSSAPFRLLSSNLGLPRYRSMKARTNTQYFRDQCTTLLSMDLYSGYKARV
ncbi:hypothetical protein HBI24_215440 [Parastagonospora nodorum]|nr:hypothetical protein HBH51_186190 [Parastagonospora nodorum]KAH4253352.1 hypothetical protein HBI03_195930 [Parastagonospora nodorum]KAH4264952.1 hypothetical protein HBI04_185470 [Parastagonospora nodorum]KAH4895494.1 hypothetical protein HBI80_217620 [Parastagonospora nodorum]KAH5050717.1 hypothetical protein HBH96_183330 [Parastagonospora nodorum]